MSRKKSPNQDLIRFAKAARAKGLSYGELQVQETVRLIKEEKLDPKPRKRKYNNSR